MNQNILKGEWTELKGKARVVWGKITGDEMDMIKGEATRLEGVLQQKYGYTVERAKEEITDFIEQYENLSLQEEWNELKQKVKAKWTDLTDADLEAINGSRTQLIVRLQQKHGEKKAAIAKKIDDFLAEIT